MAYFPNGTAGMMYEEMYCSRCVHLGPAEGPGCSVMLLHMLWNYDACNGDDPKAPKDEKAKHDALNTLIPQTKDGLSTEKCTMFFPVEWLSDRGKFEIGKADQETKDRLKLEEWNNLYGKPDGEAHA
jgi:hypothetical protein